MTGAFMRSFRWTFPFWSGFGSGWSPCESDSGRLSRHAAGIDGQDRPRDVPGLVAEKERNGPGHIVCFSQAMQGATSDYLVTLLAPQAIGHASLDKPRGDCVYRNVSSSHLPRE